MNESVIKDIVEETELVVYGDGSDLVVLDVNYKLAERTFHASQGRKFNAEEQESLKTAFAERAVKDRAFLETAVAEACETHQAMVMNETTLDAGVEAFTETVTAEVQEALQNRGISWNFSFDAYPEANIRRSRLVSAAETLEA